MAAWLKMLGYKLSRIQSATTFVFEPVRKRDLTAFHNSWRKVNAARLFAHYRELQLRLFELAGRNGTERATSPAIAA
jgi:hypothetical protein